MQSSITAQDRDFMETWENIAPYQSAIVRLDPRGMEKAEVIQGRRNFMLTTEDRIITQSKVLDPANDPFKNGAFRPVVVPDDITVQTNPNALSDEDILKILRSESAVAWSEWLLTLDSIATLRRMMDLAEGEENLSLKRFRDIERRIVEVRGTDRPQLEVKDEQLKRFLSDRPGGQGGAGGDLVNGSGNPRRGQGGRSSDYR